MSLSGIDKLNVYSYFYIVRDSLLDKKCIHGLNKCKYLLSSLLDCVIIKYKKRINWKNLKVVENDIEKIESDFAITLNDFRKLIFEADGKYISIAEILSNMLNTCEHLFVLCSRKIYRIREYEYNGLGVILYIKHLLCILYILVDIYNIFYNE